MPAEVARAVTAQANLRLAVRLAQDLELPRQSGTRKVVRGTGNREKREALRSHGQASLRRITNITTSLADDSPAALMLLSAGEMATRLERTFSDVVSRHGVERNRAEIQRGIARLIDILEKAELTYSQEPAAAAELSGATVEDRPTVSRVAASATNLIAGCLPAADRNRYRQEFQGELWELARESRRAQWRYVVNLLAVTWSLRCELRRAGQEAVLRGRSE